MRVPAFAFGLCVLGRAAACASLPAPVPSAGSALCVGAASEAEVAFALPPGLLHAISDVETGRPVRSGPPAPWPWTVGVGGEGFYFPDKRSAVAWVEAAQARGVASIDVGCMQVNLMYHPHAFADLASAFDPVRNARYAAGFLVSLHARTGDWDRAIGFYHSQTMALAVPYHDRVERWLAASHPRPRPTAVEQLAAAWSATLSGGDGDPPPDGDAP